MSVRLSLPVVVGTVLVIGCSQPSSPTQPSSSVSGTVSPQAISNFAPVFARLNVVDNFVVSANQQLTLFYTPPDPVAPPDPVTPPDPVRPLAQNSLSFYLKANAVLDGIPPNPISPVDV